MKQVKRKNISIINLEKMSQCKRKIPYNKLLAKISKCKSIQDINYTHKKRNHINLIREYIYKWQTEKVNYFLK